MGINFRRDMRIVALYLSGVTLQAIGERYGLTRERVRQIVSRNGVCAHDGGKQVALSQKAALRESLADERSFRKRGCDRATYKEISQQLDRHGKTPQKRYFEHKNNCERMKLDWQFSFYEWWLVWEQSGMWLKRGRHCDGYVMARIDKNGPFSADNVEIISQSEQGYWTRAGERK